MATIEICSRLHTRMLISPSLLTLYMLPNRDRNQWMSNNVCTLNVITKVTNYPLNSLSCVLFLFQDEHMMIEELLQLLVDKVDPQLFKRVKLQHINNSMYSIQRTSNISNPAISSTPMKWLRTRSLPDSVLLHRSINQLNIRAYAPFARLDSAQFT